LEESIKGIADAAKNLYNPRFKPESLPFVSGNVSLYNQSSTGVSVPPSPIIACVGVSEDASKAITMELKKSESLVVLVGKRYDELGGSEYYRTIHNEHGANLPIIRYPEERGIIYGTVDAIDQRMILAAHDISNGGMLISAIEMLLACHSSSPLGLELDIHRLQSDLDAEAILFAESSGMLLEIIPRQLESVKQVYKHYGLDVFEIGRTTSNRTLVVNDAGRNLVSLEVDTMRKTWRGDFGLTLAS